MASNDLRAILTIYPMRMIYLCSTGVHLDQTLTPSTTSFPKSPFSFSNTGWISSSKNSCVCSFALPMNNLGSTSVPSLSCTASNSASLAMRSSKSFDLPSPLTTLPASMEWTRIASWSSCLSPPALTHSMRITSVAMKGNSSITCFSTTLGQTTIPSAIFINKFNTTSTAKNPSGSIILRMALSSKVRSNHWLACVFAALGGKLMMYLLSEQHLSDLMGLRLYAMAELPI
mmetsp:Transcript_5336/g.10481  ORF Transcript_5336/g.10481 Transcript_5336/m.10481 type:complete len:230 (+) Transcript_5336:71-760(+)